MVSPRRAEEGFTLIALLVVVAVINIGLGVAVTSWVIIDKRANEAELIWRGEQYARAVACHQTEEGAYPEKLEDLLESDCIRALYPDPMTASGEWMVLRQRQTTGDAADAGDDPAGDGLDDGAAAAPDSPGDGTSLQQEYEQLLGLGEGPNQELGSDSAGGIVGVASRSTAAALRTYNRERTYNAWQFVAR